jgi:prepilin-type N-terminal cleavage/methylation domain-containing protein
MSPRPAGFTLIELVMVVAMIAVLSVIAAPSLRDVIRNARMTSLANDLLTDLSIARAEAVKRGAPTAICTSNNGTSCTATAWSAGWIVFSDSGPDKGGLLGKVDSGLAAPDTDIVIKVAPVIDGAIDNPPSTIVSTNHSVQGGAMWVGFRPSGVVTAGGAGPTITFNLCDARTIANVGNGAAFEKGRQVTVSSTGRAFVQRFTCP